MPAYWGIEHEIEQALLLGVDTLVFGYWLPAERLSFASYERMAEVLNLAGEQCRKANLRLLYHNHCFEFKPFEQGIPYQYLFEQTDLEYLGIELDVFWAQVAGHSPVDLIKRYGPRIKQLHLKTGVLKNEVCYDEKKYPKQGFCALGEGMMDIKKILKTAKKSHVQRIYVEQDASPDIYGDIEISFRYLSSYSHL